MKIHKHHLVPRHRGGTDDDGLVSVSITKHAMFHFCEWRLWGHPEDKLAWKALSGQITSPEISEELESIRRHKISLAHKGHNRNHTEETKRKISEGKKGKPQKVDTKARGLAISRGKKGKKFSESHKESLKNSHGRKVVYLGVEYPTLSEASRRTGISRTTLSRKLCEVM